MVHFAKKSNFQSIDFLHFFAKHRKSVEKMIHQKKNRGHQTSKTVKSRQSYSNGHLPYHCSFVTLHTKTRLMKHGNLGETRFQKGFQTVSNSRNQVSKGFLKSFQRVSKGFLKSFQRVSKAFPKGSKLLKPGF